MSELSCIKIGVMELILCSMISNLVIWKSWKQKIYIPIFLQSISEENITQKSYEFYVCIQSISYEPPHIDRLKISSNLGLRSITQYFQTSESIFSQMKNCSHVKH